MSMGIYERVWMATSAKHREGIQELTRLYYALMAEPCKCVYSDEYLEYVETIKDHVDEEDFIWVVRNPFLGNLKSFECLRCSGLSQLWDLIKDK